MTTYYEFLDSERERAKTESIKEDNLIQVVMRWLLQHGFITHEEWIERKSERLTSIKYDPFYDSVKLRFDDAFYINVYLDNRTDEVNKVLVVCDDIAEVYNKDGFYIREKIK